MCRFDVEQVVQRQRHHLRAFNHVIDADPFVGAMGEIQDARTVGDAVMQIADAGDVLLVVGAR